MVFPHNFLLQSNDRLVRRPAYAIQAQLFVHYTSPGWPQCRRKTIQISFSFSATSQATRCAWCWLVLSVNGNREVQNFMQKLEHTITCRPPVTIRSVAIHDRAKETQMITLKLTPVQAQALHELLTKMDIEPLSMGTSTLNRVTLPLEHPLWPLLDDLRQQLQIHLLRQAK